MCGIVGYIGSSNARNIIIEGLEKLEYRGYDSAGITLYNLSSNLFNIYKDIGRVSTLSKTTHNILSNIGIGATYKCQVKNGQKCAVKIPQFDSILTYL